MRVTRYSGREVDDTIPEHLLGTVDYSAAPSDPALGSARHIVIDEGGADMRQLTGDEVTQRREALAKRDDNDAGG